MLPLSLSLRPLHLPLLPNLSQQSPGLPPSGLIQMHGYYFIPTCILPFLLQFLLWSLLRQLSSILVYIDGLMT